MTPYTIEVCDRHWRICSSNGKILVHSEQYFSKWNAKRAAKRLSKMTGLPIA